MGQFDLIKVVIGGDEIEARPTEWAGTSPIRFQTTCPKCSQLIDFTGVDFICRSCDTAGSVMREEAPETEAPVPEVKIREPQAQTQKVEHVANQEAITDPLETGAFPRDLVDLEYGVVREP